MATKFEKTPEGFLKGRAVITSTGIFEYLNADGSVRRELRLPEEVFSKDFLESVKLIPITMLHPASSKVDATNVKDLQIGMVGSNPSDPADGTSDNYYLSVDMVITDADAIKKIEGGTRALSVGYSCDLEPAEPDARWCGQAYDFIQRNLRAQHLSVVPAGRQGDQAMIKLDAAGNAVIDNEEFSKEETVMAEPIDVNVKVDASEVQNLIKAEKDRADGLQVSLDNLTTEKARIEAERDTHKDRADKAEAKIKELEDSRLDEKAIEAAVARRVRILDAASKAGVEVKTDMAESDIQKAVVMKVFPKANFDGKDQVYLDARFDGAIEQLAESANADAEVRKLNADELDTKSDKKDEAVSADKARQAYLDRLNKKE
jgi:hypothetical protein